MAQHGAGLDIDGDDLAGLFVIDPQAAMAVDRAELHGLAAHGDGRQGRLLGDVDKGHLAAGMGHDEGQAAGRIIDGRVRALARGHRAQGRAGLGVDKGGGVIAAIGDQQPVAGQGHGGVGAHGGGEAGGDFSAVGLDHHDRRALSHIDAAQGRVEGGVVPAAVRSGDMAGHVIGGGLGPGRGLGQGGGAQQDGAKAEGGSCQAHGVLAWMMSGDW